VDTAVSPDCQHGSVDHMQRGHERIRDRAHDREQLKKYLSRFLPDVDILSTINRRTNGALSTLTGMVTPIQVIGRSLWRPLLLVALLVSCPGCSQRERAESPGSLPPRVLVVAPVQNLSDSEDFDALRISDLIASEFLSFDNVAVVPLNLTLAELERQGRCSVETPEDAVELARALGADATIVSAITEYDPYPPPVVGLIMQWYPAHAERREEGFDPVTASRAVSSGPENLSEGGLVGPRWQVQRVFNAADESVLRQLRAYAATREGHDSPYGWRKYIRSQELYVRYCGWATIRTMLTLDDSERAVVEPNEAES